MKSRSIVRILDFVVTTRYAMRCQVAVSLLLLFVLSATTHASSAGTSPVDLAKTPKAITVISSRNSSSLRTFTIVLHCDTDALRAQGLQGFRPLKAGEAALFTYRIPEATTFWMGSVSFPIDIIFVGPDRTVVRVYRRCLPGSRKLYPSGEKIQWVIETAAGSGIQGGDRVVLE